MDQEVGHRPCPLSFQNSSTLIELPASLLKPEACGVGEADDTARGAHRCDGDGGVFVLGILLAEGSELGSRGR
jgi:hypothetical protein